MGKAGVTVELYTCVGDMPDTLATQVTDAGGNYNFAGLTPGEYIVKFIAADGSVPRPPTWATTPSIRTRVRTD